MMIRRQASARAHEWLLVGMALALVGVHCSSEEGDGGNTLPCRATGTCPDGDGGTDAPGADGSPGDAGDDGGDPALRDDPCPEKVDFINCSQTCALPGQNCERDACTFYEDCPGCTGTTTSIDGRWPLPLVIRTPRNGGAAPSCSYRCEKPAVDNDGELRMSIFARNRPEVRVRVAWPWKIAFADTAVCAPVQCAVGKDFIVYANDADMHARRLPSRNIIIDEVPSEGSPCP